MIRGNNVHICTVVPYSGFSVKIIVQVIKYNHVVNLKI